MAAGPESKRVTTVRYFSLEDGYCETMFETQNEEELAMLWWNHCKRNHIISAEKHFLTILKYEPEV